MDIIFLESRSPNLFSLAISNLQKLKGSEEANRTFWPSHVILGADSHKINDDRIIFEADAKTLFIRAAFFSKYGDRKRRVYRDKNNIQCLGNMKEKINSKMYAYGQIFGYIPMLLWDKKFNIFPWGEVCNETIHRWALDKGYKGGLENYKPDSVWPVLFEDILRKSPEWELMEEIL